MSTDAIVLLKQDHTEIRKLFKAFQTAGENADATKAKIVDQILEALTVHTYLENECMYPETRKLLPDLEDDVLESYEEHHVADVLSMELATMSPDDERFDAKVTVLIENVTHHIEEEEQDWFPKVRAGLGRKQLQDIGARMIELREKAPPPAEPAVGVEEGDRRRYRLSAAGAGFWRRRAQANRHRLSAAGARFWRRRAQANRHP